MAVRAGQWKCVWGGKVVMDILICNEPGEFGNSLLMSLYFQQFLWPILFFSINLNIENLKTEEQGSRFLL